VVVVLKMAMGTSPADNIVAYRIHEQNLVPAPAPTTRHRRYPVPAPIIRMDAGMPMCPPDLEVRGDEEGGHDEDDPRGGEDGDKRVLNEDVGKPASLGANGSETRSRREGRVRKEPSGRALAAAARTSTTTEQELWLHPVKTTGESDGCRCAAWVGHGRVVVRAATVVWTSLGPLPRWVPGPTTRWALGTTRLALHGT
jgi:hypothetical protein